MKIYSVYGLIDAYKQKYPYSHYFDRETLKWFGETISSMRLLKARATITDYSGEKHECYVLSRLQKKHPLGPRRSYAYFDVDTLAEISPCEGG